MKLSFSVKFFFVLVQTMCEYLMYASTSNKQAVWMWDTESNECKISFILILYSLLSYLIEMAVSVEIVQCRDWVVLYILSVSCDSLFEFVSLLSIWFSCLCMHWFVWFGCCMAVGVVFQSKVALVSQHQIHTCVASHTPVVSLW